MANGTVLVADDDAAIRTVLNQALARAGYDVRVTSNAGTLWRWVAAGEGDIVVTDVVMPDENAFDLLPRIKKIRPELPVIVMSAQNTFMTAIRASERGAYEYLPKPFDLTELLNIVGRAMAEPKRPVVDRNAEEQPDSMPLVGRSPAMQEIYRMLARMMQTDLTVMITGESGTGKEVVARFIHQQSNRAAGPFVGVNCAAIPEHMMEATLFGHEKGAFTGAHQTRPGKFEVCDGGTLLLDEISEMSLELQAKLLRVLQEREVERIGAHKPRSVDVRVLATSNRDLKEAVREGRFREDLYFRLSVFPLQLEPLRQRVEDIVPLAEWFLAKHGARMGRPDAALSPAAREVLVTHPWPGNVRELENAIQRALVMVDGTAVEPEHLGIDGPSAAAAPDGAALETRVRDAEETLIQQTLASCNGRRKDAARALGISERTLRYKLARLREREELVP